MTNQLPSEKHRQGHLPEMRTCVACSTSIVFSWMPKRQKDNCITHSSHHTQLTIINIADSRLEKHLMDNRHPYNYQQRSVGTFAFGPEQRLTPSGLIARIAFVTWAPPITLPFEYYVIHNSNYQQRNRLLGGCSSDGDGCFVTAHFPELYGVALLILYSKIAMPTIGNLGSFAN